MSQGIPSSVANANPNADTQIHLIYPKLEQEIYEDSTFLMGQVTACPPGASLEVDLVSGGKPESLKIPMSPQGFFAFKVPIHPGMNPMALNVRQNSAVPPTAQHLFALHGAEPLPVLPAHPLAVHEETLQPASDVWLTEHDSLTITCSASIDAQVAVDIPGFLKQPLLLQPILTTEPFLDTREPIFAQMHWNSQRTPTQGYYRLQVSVRQILQSIGLAHLDQEYLDLPLVLQLRHEDEVLKLPLPGKLSLIRQSRAALVVQDRAVTRTAPESGARLTPQRENTQVWVDGLQQGWARVRLSQDESFFLPVDTLSFATPESAGSSRIMPSKAAALSLTSIRSQAVGETASVVKLEFSGNGATYEQNAACPVQLEVIPSKEMNRLQVRLYGVCSRCDFIHYPPDDAVVWQIHWRPVAEDVLELWIDLYHPLSGYDYAWRDGQWQFTVKVLPRRLEQVRVLIDPGHGGTETGSTGLNGLPEKELNLTVSRLLRDTLLQAGYAQVMLTRNTDEALSLAARGNAVQETQADIVLSIHHNALPDGRDPLKVEGASCFYYQSFAKKLAQDLLMGLTDNRGSRFEVPNYGLFYDSLYMTRIHQATAVLVEIGFFTNPWEFERLLDPEFQKAAVQRLASALRTYCLKQTS